MRHIRGRRGTVCIWLAIALSAAASIAFGTSVADLAVAALVVTATNLLPGVVLWRALRPRRGWWVEDLGLGWGCSLG